MIRDLFGFFAGWYRVSVSCEDSARAADVMYRHGISCTSAALSEDGEYSFSLTLASWKELAECFDSECITYTRSRLFGFPAAVKWLTSRPGFIAGIVFFIAFTYWASNIVWNIDISGCEAVSESEVIELLSELGCGYGNYIPSVDFDSLHSEFLVRSDDISWISVNMKGTHAMVQLRETRRGGGEGHTEGVFANLVAKEDAVIKLAQVASGLDSVSPGDVVKKGEILVSGVIPVREGKVRYEYAEGEVMAYVTRKIEVNIPFKDTQKVYTGRKKCENSIKIFEKSINLSLKGGIEYTTYDKIVKSERVYLFGAVPLPIWLTSVTYKEYEHVPHTNNREECTSKALSELRDRMDEALRDAELVSSRYSSSISADSLSVVCHLTCITDIAQVLEFTVGDETSSQDDGGT